MTGRRLSMTERVSIEVAIARGDSDEEIAVRLGRHRSTSGGRLPRRHCW